MPARTSVCVPLARLKSPAPRLSSHFSSFSFSFSFFCRVWLRYVFSHVCVPWYRCIPSPTLSFSPENPGLVQYRLRLVPTTFD
ncbi:uncharacterized protein BO72DRAFT_88170 [Aspergillus fijiensis CBS 313.89]|uniref:Uncharacterized protein n=1 Tax=Aspergillus fijiensis CBS 313.89 TaxID=1448319 RepID=A0A8G1W478_9EURO|nr:uncharacterized protein BO72DRAFT_88170 [Aspergillus fijiensis CBS 313.89]RAK82351.1 hypothetical protein BO72DRAFT_88170 [Aspergillus fijiensis CBS 313.89]